MKFEEGLNWNGKKYVGKSLGKNGKGFPLLKLRMYEKFSYMETLSKKYSIPTQKIQGSPHYL